MRTPSSPQVARTCVSRANDTHHTLAECLSSVARRLPFATFQSSMILLWPPAEASTVPSGENASELKPLLAQSREASSLPLPASHSFTFLSPLAEATILPLGAKATAM